MGDDLLAASLPDGTSLAEVVESVFVLAGDLPESDLVASLFESVLKASVFVDDGAPNDGVLDDGSGDDGTMAGGVLPGALKPEAVGVAPGAAGVETTGLEPGGFNEGAVVPGVAGAWPIACAAIATIARSINVKRILRVTGFVSSVVFRLLAN
jgi:hypothetical protein